MNPTILVTNTRYISREHVDRLQAAGYTVHRHAESRATEEQLRALVGQASGYIHGGGEKVTRSVVDAAASLRGIAFCGSGWTETIVAHEALTSRGIPIATTAGSNALSVAQYTISLITAALRRVPFARPRGSEPGVATAFLARPPREWSALSACVVGAGHIGSAVTELLAALGFRVRLLDRELTRDVTAFDQALAGSDVVVVCVSKLHGEHVLGERQLSRLEDGALVVNPVFPEAIDQDALYAELASGRLAAAVDALPAFDRSGLPTGALLHSDAGAGYDTADAILRTSDWATESMLNLLTHGDDPRVVNPGFREPAVGRDGSPRPA